jgi:hypothetical protein
MKAMNNKNTSADFIFSLAKQLFAKRYDFFA